MARRFYTVLILPDATTSPRKFHITKAAITVLSSVGAVLVVAFGFFVYQYVHLNVRMLELKQLRQEAGDRSVLVEKVTQLETEVSRMRDLDRRLRVAVGIEKADAQPSALAQGGADNVVRTGLIDALRQRTGRLLDWVNRDLAALGEEITSREKSFRELKTYLEEKQSVLAATPTILPVKGLLTATFGYRKSPFTGGREYHEGLDLAAPYGTPVQAAADGVVSFAGPLAAYGNVVFINHGHGFQTFYGHNSSNRVREGQTVRRGDIIAYVGTTGRTTGPHVHYEVHLNGSLVNPLQYAIDTTGIRIVGEGEGEKENPS